MDSLFESSLSALFVNFEIILTVKEDRDKQKNENKVYIKDRFFSELTNFLFEQIVQHVICTTIINNNRMGVYITIQSKCKGKSDFSKVGIYS